MVKTLKINDDTHARLKKVGYMGETFDHAINKLLDLYFSNEVKNKRLFDGLREI